RFRDPYLRVGQASVLQRRLIELHTRAQTLGHLADGGTETAGAAIGDGVIQPRVARLQQHIQQLLLGDSVADLHRAAANTLRLRGQLNRGECRPVDTVAAGAAADRDDQVAIARLLDTAVHLDQADRAAVNQGVAQITLVEANGTVDGG